MVGLSLAGVGQSASIALSPVLASVVAFAQALSASLSLTPGIGEGLAGVSQSVYLALSPSLQSALAFFATLSATLSLSPSLGQAIAGVANSVSTSLSSSLGAAVAGVTESVSTTLSPSVNGVAAFLAALSASISLTPELNQGLGGITNALTIGLSPTLTSALAFFATVSAAVSLVPSVDQDIAGVSNALSVSLSQSLGEGVAGVTNVVSTTLTPAVNGAAAFLASVSAAIALAPAVGQGIEGLTQSASLALSSSISSLAAFAEMLSASMSIAPSLSQDLADISNALSVAIAPSLDEGIAGISGSATVTLTPTLSGAAAFLETLSASLLLAPALNQGLAGVASPLSMALSPALAGAASFFASVSASLGLAPSIGEGLAGITQSLSSSLTASVNQGIGGVTEVVGTTISPILEGLISFFEAVLGITTLAPSLSVASGLTEYASVALAPSIMAIASVPPAALTAILCSPSVVAEGVSAKCAVTVTGASPTGTVSFSSLSGTFAPASDCTLSGGSCEIDFVAPSSPGSFTINATYSGDSHNSGSSQTFAVTVPTFGISATSGAVGTSTELSGSGFVPSAVYDYCFEAGIAAISGASACSQMHQFVASSSGAIPVLTVIVPSGQSGLVVVSGSGGGLAAFQSFAVTPSATHAAITLSPNSGASGTPVTVIGSSFTPGATVAISYTNGTVVTEPSVITASSVGGFTATFSASSSSPGAGGNVVSAIGSDPADSASAVFTATNVATYGTTSVPVSAGGTVLVNQTGTTGVTLSISSPSAASGTVVVVGPRRAAVVRRVRRVVRDGPVLRRLRLRQHTREWGRPSLLHGRFCDGRLFDAVLERRLVGHGRLCRDGHDHLQHRRGGRGHQRLDADRDKLRDRHGAYGWRRRRCHLHLPVDQAYARDGRRARELLVERVRSDPVDNRGRRPVPPYSGVPRLHGIHLFRGAPERHRQVRLRRRKPDARVLHVRGAGVLLEHERHVLRPVAPEPLLLGDGRGERLRGPDPHGPPARLVLQRDPHERP